MDGKWNAECGVRSMENEEYSLFTKQRAESMQLAIKRTVFKYFPENANVLTERTITANK